MALAMFDEEAGCPKCGQTWKVQVSEETFALGIRTEYCAKPTYGKVCFMSDLVECSEAIRGEHMHRICTRCGFVWFEACRPGPGVVWTQVVKDG